MEEEAEKALDPYGLIVKETLKINNSQKKGMVLEQSVKKGTQMKKGDTVTLTICDHDPVMKVPDLSDMTKAQAQKALNNTGLVAKFTEEYDDTIESGKVISQDPEPGSNLKDGGMVKVSISKGKDPTRKAPTSPVGSGYTDYLSIDIDNDGEKEMLQLYNNGGEIFLRIYKTQSDYTEIDVTPGADSGTDICYDPNRGGTYLYSMGNFGITDLLTDREITSMDFKDDSWVERVYYVSGKEVSEDTYYDYMDRVEILYSVYPAGTFG